MIVDPAFADVLERQFDGIEIAGLAGALAGPPQKFQQHGLREFWRAFGAAVVRINEPGKLLGSRIEFGNSDDYPALGARALSKTFHQGAPVLLDAFRIVAEDARHIMQHVDKGRLAVAALVGK